MSTDKTYIVEQQIVVTQEFLVTAPTKKEALRLVNEEAHTSPHVDPLGVVEGSTLDSERKATRARLDDGQGLDYWACAPINKGPER